MMLALGLGVPVEVMRDLAEAVPFEFHVAETLEHAEALLDTFDYSVVCCNPEASEEGCRVIVSLLGLTSPTTRVIAVIEEPAIEQVKELEALGVPVFAHAASEQLASTLAN